MVGLILMESPGFKLRHAVVFREQPSFMNWLWQLFYVVPLTLKDQSQPCKRGKPSGRFNG